MVEAVFKFLRVNRCFGFVYDEELDGNKTAQVEHRWVDSGSFLASVATSIIQVIFIVAVW